MPSRNPYSLLAIALLTGVLALPRSAHAEEELPPSHVKTPGDTAATIQKILQTIPGASAARCFVNDFLSVAGVKTYDSAESTQSGNLGLVAHFEGLAQGDPKLTKQLQEYYREVDQRTKNPGGEVFSDETRPFLKEEAGDKNNERLRAGWAWDLALKHAEGDPNRAMQLVGYCGHDDTAQGEIPALRATAEEMQPIRASLAKVTKSVIAALEENAANPSSEPVDQTSCVVKLFGGTSKAPTQQLLESKKFNLAVAALPPDQIEFALSQIPLCKDPVVAKLGHETLQKFLEGGVAIPPSVVMPARGCPLSIGNAAFYLPKSLGANVDLSPRQKKKLQELIQSPTVDTCTDGNCLPAKYYHVYGAAAVACEMIARGHSPRLVVEASAASGWAYRSMWLTAMVDKLCADEVDGVPAGKALVTGWSNVLHDLLHFSPENACSPDSPDDQEENVQPVADKPYEDPQTVCDAAELMRHETLSGNLGQSLGTIYTDLPIGKTFLQGLSSGRFKNADSELTRKWGAKRFKRARGTVAAIKAEFSWTREQHRIGAEFAATVCRKNPALKNACGSSAF